MEENPIRVAQIIGKWTGGGVEAVVMNYYRNIDKSKVQFDFFCDNDSTNIPYEEIKRLGGKIILIPPYQKMFRYQKILKQKLREGNYKIVHSHINTLSIFPLFAAKVSGVPIRIAHSHSTTNKKELKKNLLKQMLRPFSRKYATNFLACSELAGRWLFGDKAFNNKRVTIINNAIDVEKFKYNKEIREKKRKKLGISADTLVIGHIGRFVEQKNHLMLIDIFNEIHKKNNNSILMLVGQGPLLQKVNEKICNLELEKSIKVLGQRDNIEELYQIMDIFLLPSLYEGLPVVGVEAQASGLLCILSDSITKETKILNTTQYLSLSQTAEEWAKKIIEYNNNFERKNTTKEMKENRFDIKEEANKLQEFYINESMNYGE